MGVPVKPKQEILRVLWKYPEAAKWIIEAFNENIEKLEEQLERTRKARDDIRNYKSKK